MIIVLIIGGLLILIGIASLIFGIYLYRKAKKQHQYFLETQKDFKEYQQFKKEILTSH